MLLQIDETLVTLQSTTDLAEKSVRAQKSAKKVVSAKTFACTYLYLLSPIKIIKATSYSKGLSLLEVLFNFNVYELESRSKVAF